MSEPYGQNRRSVNQRPTRRTSRRDAGEAQQASYARGYAQDAPGYADDYGQDAARARAQTRMRAGAEGGARRAPQQGAAPARSRAQQAGGARASQAVRGQQPAPDRARGQQPAPDRARAQAEYARAAYERPQDDARRSPYGRTVASDRYARPISSGQGGFTAAVRQPYGGRRRTFTPVSAIALLVLVLAVVAAVVWFTLLSPVSITLNGATVEVPRDASIERVIEAAHIQTVPGKLLAIDGSVLDETGGEAYTAVLNGVQVGADATVAADDVLEIGPGADATEPYSETTEPIPAQFLDTDTWGAIQEIVGTQTDGVRATRTGDISGIVMEGVVEREPDDAVLARYSVDTGGEKVIALTFDDGPWPDQTVPILDILEENGAVATFFIVGQCVDNITSDAWQRMVNAGHQLCSHSYDHAEGSGRGVNLGYMSAEEQHWEIEEGQRAIREAAGVEPSHAIRAPGGNFTFEIAQNVRDLTTMNVNWNVDTEDWTRPGSDAIYEAILSAGPGDIILMHDGGGDRSQTIEALRAALPVLRERGYSFVTIDQLVAMDKGGKGGLLNADGTRATGEGEGGAGDAVADQSAGAGSEDDYAAEDDDYDYDDEDDE